MKQENYQIRLKTKSIEQAVYSLQIYIFSKEMLEIDIDFLRKNSIIKESHLMTGECVIIASINKKAINQWKKN